MTGLGQRLPTAVVYGAIVLAALFAPPEVFVGALGLLAFLALLELLRMWRAGLPAVLELVILALGTASLIFLRYIASPFGPLLMTILAVWAADVVAYAVGSTIGRRKIAPRISPGKTWEGTIAGFLAAAGAVVLTNAPVVGIHAWWVAAAVLIGPAAFAGDLVESWVKRRVGAKDSGALLPGHGGVLDRIDSLVAAAPVVALSLLLLGRMG